MSIRAKQKLKQRARIAKIRANGSLKWRRLAHAMYRQAAVREDFSTR